MSSMRTKKCGYGCGIEIYWDDEIKRYCEVDNREPHRCPNYSKDKIPSSSSTSTYSPKPKPREETNKKMENSFTYLTGSVDFLSHGYEKISDIVRDANGRIHGSQRGVDKDGNMDLVVYWEVPTTYRTNVKESIASVWQEDDY